MRTVPILRPAEHPGRSQRYTVIGDGLEAAPTEGGICRLIRQRLRHRRPGWMLTMRERGQHDGMLLIEADCGRGVTTRIGPTKNRGPRRQFRLGEELHAYMQWFAGARLPTVRFGARIDGEPAGGQRPA